MELRNIMKKFLTLSSLLIITSISLTSCGYRNKKHAADDGITHKINQKYKDGCNKPTRENCAIACAETVCMSAKNDKLSFSTLVNFWNQCQSRFSDTVKKLAKDNSPEQLCQAAGPLGKTSATDTGFTTIIGSIKPEDRESMKSSANDDLTNGLFSAEFMAKIKAKQKIKDKNLSNATNLKSKDKNLNNAAKDIGLSDSDLANIKTNLRSCARLHFCGKLTLNK
jgi:hypothetical protein